MLGFIKKSGIFILLLCPEGVAILLVCTIMEGLYRASIALGYSNNNLEFLALGFGIFIFIVLFSFKLFAYLVKRKNKPKGL
ncbi:hypothetical protein [Thalassomonas haliotis]|uniref:Uncharacterized protein n=1 Tax=Thalassomonas haliotis TaxID=485448 RepID=A0ABY7VDL0_9GAMM|nr:hypothetical protein [Thalassomonas haliotis]WDE11747.1 hypothetical protein H3N35_26735 [Thalassomonas haliotis]